MPVVVRRFGMVGLVWGPGMVLFMVTVLTGRSLVVGRGLSIGPGLRGAGPGLLLLLHGLLPPLPLLPPLSFFPLSPLSVQVVVYLLWLWLGWGGCSGWHIATRDRLASPLPFIFFVEGFVDLIGTGRRVLLVERRVGDA